MPVKTVPNLNRKYRKDEATCKGIILELEADKLYTHIVRRISGRFARGKPEFPGGATSRNGTLGKALATELRKEARLVDFVPKKLVYHAGIPSRSDQFRTHHKLFFAVTDPVFDPDLPLQDYKMTEPERVRVANLNPDDMAQYHGRALERLQKDLNVG